MKVFGTRTIALMGVLVVSLGSAASKAGSVVFFDNFEDNDVSDWVGTPLVYNDLAIGLGQVYEPPLPDVHDGWVWGKGSGFTNPRYTWIVRPATISAPGELAVEFVGHAGPGISSTSVHLLATGWPRDGHVYGGPGYFQGEIVDAWAEGYEFSIGSGSSERFVHLRLHHFVGETRVTEVLFEWGFEGVVNDDTYRLERNSEGRWSLYYGEADGSNMSAAPIGEIRDLTFTSFGHVALAMFREDSALDYVRVEAVAEPPECCPGLGGSLGDGLVAYYPFEGNANDASGNGNDGAEQGTPLYVGGVCGEAIDIDGADDYVQVPGEPLNLGTSDVTLSAWIRANTLSQEGHGVISKRDGSVASSAGYSLGVNGDNQRAYASIGDGSGTKAFFQSVSVVTDGQWHLITAVCDRDGFGRIYVDGAPDGEPTSISHRSGYMDNEYDLLIGKTVASFGQAGYFLGDIDEVRIYDRTLLACEIRQLACAPGNAPPIADAGEDQTVYADCDFTTEVVLDGSDSSDPDGDEVTYTWTWTINGETYQAEGVNPVIELPPGEHTIELVVNDGEEDSEPDQVVITVIAPMEANLWVVPRVINRYSRMRQIMAMVRLAGVSRDQVDAETPLMLYPGGIEALSQRASECGRGGTRGTMILASFDKSDLMDATTENGRVGLTAVGRLKSGQYFCGTDTIWIIAPGLPR